MERNRKKPEGLYFATTTEEEFRLISSYFQPPIDEGFRLLKETGFEANQTP
jgi:hypothetical protein